MREKFRRFWDTTNPDLLRLVIIFVLVGLLLAGFLLFGRSSDGGSVLPAWAQTGRVEPPDERLAAAQKENPDTVAWITIRAWLTLLPLITPVPEISHFLAIVLILVNKLVAC